MKCPLRLIGFEGDLGLAEFPQVNCLQEECAWWDKKNGVCAILVLAYGIEDLWRAQDNLAREINQLVSRK